MQEGNPSYTLKIGEYKCEKCGKTIETSYYDFPMLGHKIYLKKYCDLCQTQNAKQTTVQEPAVSALLDDRVPHQFRDLMNDICPLKKEHIEKAFNFDFKKKCCLLIYGSVGKGKTLLAYQKIRDCLKKKLIRRYAVCDGLQFFKVSSLYIERDQLNEYRDYCYSDLLFIDNFGVGYFNDKNICDMLYLIDYRFSHHKPTIIATPYNKDTLKKYSFNDSILGDMIVKRLIFYSELVNLDK